jgi:hypothetical protein
MSKNDQASIIEKPSGRSKGGFSRAQSLTPEARKSISQKAAFARWNGDLPIATHEGAFNLGQTDISCAVLPNGQRVITQATFLRSLARSTTPKAGSGVLSTIDSLPYFLQAEVFKPFIDEELRIATTPIFYSTLRGKGVGYDANLLPKVADVYLKFRDSCAKKGVEVPKRYQNMIFAADTLVRGLASVGIIALIDEATGYQRDRAKDALQKILEAFIAKELRAWVKTFPDDFYEELFRLRGLNYLKDTVKRPQYFGKLTNSIVYERLAPGVLDELKRTTPKNDSGKPKYQLFRRLTEDYGHPKLRELLISIVTIMKLSANYNHFIQNLDRIHPKYNHPLPLKFNNDDLGFEGL